MTRETNIGPLNGLRMVEFGGIGPAPFCAMMLADMGADVIRIDHPNRGDLAVFDSNPRQDILNRGRRSIALDLKEAESVDLALRLIAKADGLIEGFRPGVMERLGLGPDICLDRNRRLVYGRMTGWGQSGPLAQAAGHDINYIALTGALHTMGDPGSPPSPPLNLVGDFGGGGMLLAFGMMCAIFEAQQSGEGQIIDAAMTDGAATLMTSLYGLRTMGHWGDQRGGNLLDGSAPFYSCYECADGKYIAVGAIEARFYQLLLEKVSIETSNAWKQFGIEKWPEQKRRLAEIFRTKPRDAWCDIMEGTDICFAPVLDMVEAPAHPHNVARNTFQEHHGIVQPSPAPRFSRTPGRLTYPPPLPGEHTEEILRDWGISSSPVC